MKTILCFVVALALCLTAKAGEIQLYTSPNLTLMSQ